MVNPPCSFLVSTLHTFITVGRDVIGCWMIRLDLAQGYFRFKVFKKSIGMPIPNRSTSEGWYSHHLEAKSAARSPASSSRNFLCLAGFPATIEKGSTSFVTIDPDAMTDPVPIVIPKAKITLFPIQTSCFMTGQGFLSRACQLVSRTVFRVVMSLHNGFLGLKPKTEVVTPPSG